MNTRFWDDSYVARLSPNEKLLFLYLLTNPLTNIAGVYELAGKRVAFDTMLPLDEVEETLGRFENDGKIVRHGGWIGVVNFIRHQTLNPKVRVGIASELHRAPREIVERLPVTTVGVPLAADRLSHPNLNSDFNPNSNLNSKPGVLHKPSTTELRKGMRRLHFPNLRRDRQDREGW